MMEKREELLSYLNQDLVLDAKFYGNQEIPSQISNAIYTFGDYSSFDILAFIDASIDLDGSKGMIITPEEIYFKFGQAGKIRYQEIELLSLECHRHDCNVKAVIKTKSGSYAFRNKVVNIELLVRILSKITEIDIEMVMTSHEKVAHYIPIVLNDLENDEYEDIVLTPKQSNSIKEFYKELTMVDSLSEEDYCYELENICRRALVFFEELELDSEEINILLAVQEEFDQKDEQDSQQINNAQQFYNDMMNKYQQGDTEMYDRVKGMMSSLGIDENELAGKNPDEIQDVLCDKLGVSKSMFEKLAGKFKL